MNSNLNNDSLIASLKKWGERQSNANYNAVLRELQNGHSYLLLPSNNESQVDADWTTSDQSFALKLKSIVEVDGKRVLAAFSDEDALAIWAKDDCEYTAMPTMDILDLCNREGIRNIAINIGQDSAFVISNERDTTNSDEQISIGVAKDPLSKSIIEKIKSTFQTLPFIEKSYQYGMIKGKEFINAIGVILNADTEDNRFAMQDAINKALEGEELKHPMEIMVLETKEWQSNVQQITSALFYSKD